MLGSYKLIMKNYDTMMSLKHLLFVYKQKSIINLSQMSTMDVLRPDILKIENRRYRRIPCSHRQPKENDYVRESYVEEDAYYYDEADSCQSEYDTIKETEHGFCDRMQDIPSFYFKFIIGKNSEKKKSLEHQTKTTIVFPKRGCEGDIVINGKTRSDVIAARMKIKTIVDIHRMDQRSDHFLSFPIFSQELKKNFQEFKKEVLKIQARGLDPSIFQIPERLHLTLSLLTFLSEKELLAAIPLITEQTKDIKRKYFDDGGIKISVRGVEYMNDDPSEVDVLYAKISLTDLSNRLQCFVDELVSTLASSGFAKMEYDHVKIHATIINTMFRKKNPENTATERTFHKKPRITFDAREILLKFCDYSFGDVFIDSLDFSTRGVFDADGHYRSAGCVSFS